MNDMERLNIIINQLNMYMLDKVVNPETYNFISEIANALLSQNGNYDEDQIRKIKLILDISNILYNNTDLPILPLDDGIYDMLIELYRNYHPNIPIGAKPMNIKHIGPVLSMTSNNKIKALKFLDPEFCKDSLFSANPGTLGDSLLATPPVQLYDEPIEAMRICHPIEKRIIDTPHVYPELVGTLNKCKFVLNQDAKNKNAYYDPTVKIFERDFIDKHLEQGIITPDEKFTMVAELKYDGISIEADICDGEIISARSRGDTAADLATDYTPILKGYKFMNMDKPLKCMLKGIHYGVKFEAIITYDNLMRLSSIKGKRYANCRNAVSGIFDSSDALLYRNYITLIPLSISIADELGLNRVNELTLLNTEYHSGEYNRYAVLHGDYKSILFQVKKFVEEAEYLKPFIPYMYDGVVISYVDKDKIKRLGRENSINKYSIAIKFSPLKKQTMFTHYTFSVGQNGIITPKIHYNPVEFYGTIHTKSSGHSLKRFNELGLKYGDIIEVQYTNDVMPYVTKPDLDYNINNPNPLAEFCTVCPSCGGPITISKSGSSAICTNPICPEKTVARMTNMLQKLKFKDFSEETIKKLSMFSLRDLLELKQSDIEFLGPETSRKFIDRVRALKETPILDYNIIGSLGFTDIASNKWKLILNEISYLDIMTILETGSVEGLRDILLSISGIGPVTADTICTELELFKEDLIYIFNNFNIVSTKGSVGDKFKIRFSGVRPDESLKNQLETIADIGEGSVTKDTNILVVPYIGFESSKVAKAKQYGIDIISYSEFQDWIKTVL